MKYTVKRGDTVSAIARKFGVKHDAIVKANNLKNPNLIITGQVLIIPEAEPVKDYAKIGQAVEKCLDAIEDLDEFKTLQGLLNG